MNEVRIRHRGPTIGCLNDDALKALIIYRITVDGGDLFDFKLSEMPTEPTMRRCTFDFVPRPTDTPAVWMHQLIESLVIVQPHDLGELDGFSTNLGNSLKTQMLRLIDEWTNTENYSKDCLEVDKHIAEIRPMQTLIVNYSTACIKIEPILQNSSMAVSSIYNTKADTLPDTVQSLWDSPVGEEHFITNMTTRDGVSDDFGYNGVYLPPLKETE